MRTPISTAASVTLMGVAAFNAVSAIAGFAGLVTNGIGMPRELLARSPFTSFLVPAVLLLVVVGGTQAVAAVLLMRRRPSALFWSALAGFTMVTWILVETAIIRGFSVLQALYFATGCAELVLVLALLGILAWMPAVGRKIGPKPATSGRV